jgi:hypothetical protein
LTAAPVILRHATSAARRCRSSTTPAGRGYTHKSTGKDRGAAETVAGVLLGTGWTCAGCKAVYIGTAPENGLCEVCGGGDTGAGVPVPA